MFRAKHGLVWATKFQKIGQVEGSYLRIALMKKNLYTPLEVYSLSIIRCISVNVYMYKQIMQSQLMKLIISLKNDNCVYNNLNLLEKRIFLMQLQI